MKTYLVRLLPIIALGMLAGCATPLPPRIAADPGILRVGITPNSPPMIFRQGDQMLGIDAELAEAFGKELGRKVVFTEFKWEDLLDAPEQDRADIIMSSITITPARGYRMAFTDPYMKVGQMALVRNEDKYNFQVNLANNAKRGIGVVRSTTGDQLVQQEYSRAKVKYFNSGDAAAKALVDRKIDLFVSDSPMIWYLGGQYESSGLTVAPMVFTQEYLGWGIRRQDDALRTAANAFLQKIRENGELSRIYARWMPGFR